MTIFSTTLLAGVASVAFAGTVAAHTLTLKLPDGATEQITYAGDVAPQVTITPASASPAAADWAFGPQSPFALMRQIAARMDREADAMMREMQEIAAQPLTGPGQPMPIDMSKLPPGTQSYRFVSTLSPSGVCSESTEIITRGPGQQPQVITHRSGNCGSAAPGSVTKIAVPDRAPVMQPPPRIPTYQAKAIDHPDYRSMFREASW